MYTANLRRGCGTFLGLVDQLHAELRSCSKRISQYASSLSDAVLAIYLFATVMGGIEKPVVPNRLAPFSLHVCNVAAPVR